jgi:hypothetical protein
MKKFQLEDDINIEIIPGALDLDNVSPPGSNNLKDKGHPRTKSNVTSIKIDEK